jgi:hypothetical protein
MMGMAHSSPRRQRLHRLIGRDEGAQALDVEATVRVRDELEDEVVDARVPGVAPLARRGSSRL